jgi:steroid delta-isomerase-like uncharacterized protein
MKADQAASSSSQQSASGMTRDEIVAFVERRHERYDDFDAAGLAADYADDVVVESPMSGLHHGRAAAEQALRATFNAFLDLKMTTEALLVDGPLVAHFVTTEGTHVTDLMGAPTSGKPFRLPVVFLYELKDRRIVRERRIYDFTGLLVQVGLIKAKPI